MPFVYNIVTRHLEAYQDLVSQFSCAQMVHESDLIGDTCWLPRLVKNFVSLESSMDRINEVLLSFAKLTLYFICQAISKSELHVCISMKQPLSLSLDGPLLVL